MTTTTTNTERAARLLLACLDHNPDTVTAILDEANADPSGLPGLLSAMTSAVLEIMLGTVGEENTRATLNLTILDTSMREESDHG
jgi:hypothetical protein